MRKGPLQVCPFGFLGMVFWVYLIGGVGICNSTLVPFRVFLGGPPQVMPLPGLRGKRGFARQGLIEHPGW